MLKVQKEKIQLGMSKGRARHILITKLIFEFICHANLNSCHRCKLPMTVDSYSIDHKVDWLDSLNPLEVYLDLQNIGFSHKICNSLAAKRHKNASKTKIACDYCKKEYEIYTYTFVYRKKNGQNRFFCSQSCQVKLQHQEGVFKK